MWAYVKGSETKPSTGGILHSKSEFKTFISVFKQFVPSQYSKVPEAIQWEPEVHSWEIQFSDNDQVYSWDVDWLKVTKFKEWYKHVKWE